MIAKLWNALMIKAIKLENAARLCAENGLSNGEEDGNIYKDFSSFVWFDKYNGFCLPSL